METMEFRQKYISVGIERGAKAERERIRDLLEDAARSSDLEVAVQALINQLSAADAPATSSLTDAHTTPATSTNPRDLGDEVADRLFGPLPDKASPSPNAKHHGTRDLGDQVADRLDAMRGKRGAQ